VALIIWLLFGIGIPLALYTYMQSLRGNDAVDSLEAQAGGKPTGWSQRESTGADLIRIMVYTILSVVVYAIFWRQNYFPELRYMTLPLVASLQVVIVARLSHIFVPKPLDAYCYRLFTGTAVGVFVYIMLGRSAQMEVMVSYYLGSGGAASIADMLEFLRSIVANRVYIVLGIAAVTIYKSVPLIHEVGAGIYRWRALTLAVVTALVGFGIFVVLYSFSNIWIEITGVAWVILAGMLTSVLGILAHYGRNFEDAFISEICRWLSNSKVRLFVIGAVIGAYIVFLRPFLFNMASWSTALIEWATFCFVVWRMYDGIRGRISDTYSIHLKYTSWKKHLQQVEKQTDSDFNYALNVQADFIERSHKDQLLVYLVTLMHDNGLSVEEISELLHPMSEYRDDNIPMFSFTRARNLIRDRNRQNRDQILKNIMNALSERHIQMG
jgi:hypothetical protein